MMTSTDDNLTYLDSGTGKAVTCDPRRNAEGYSDPTAYQALRNIEREDHKRFCRLLHTLFCLCELAGFEIEGRIVLVDKKSGRVWR